MYRCKGFTLLEVLIALIIIALVFLGFSGIHILTAQMNQDSLQRLMALQYAEDFSSRMVVNRPAVFDNTYASLDFTSVECDSPPPIVCQAHATETAITCTSQQMAEYDAYAVFCALQALLPELSIDIVCVDVDAADASPCSIGSMQRINIAWAVRGWKDAGGQVTDMGASECPLVSEASTHRKFCVEVQVLP